MIEFKSISKTFEGDDGSFLALDDVSLTVNENELFGVIGESGAGKSTLMRLVNSLETPDSGEVLVNGINVHQLKKKDLREHQSQIGMIFQQFNLLRNKTVEENIRIPLKLHQYENTLEVETLLDFVDLKSKRNNYPSQLSGGQKQRVGIARALVIQPKILLCDEPTSSLDQNTTEEIVHLLKKAHEKFGVTIMIVTHELDVIKDLCERTAVMEDGKIIDTIPISQSTKLKKPKSYHQRALEVLGNG